jgi:hypothetical protein
MKNLSLLGLTEVVKLMVMLLSIERVIYFISEYQKGFIMEFLFIPILDLKYFLL